MSGAALSDQQRANVEEAILRVLRRRYPGRPVSVRWDEPDSITDDAATGTHEDRIEDAA